jgi:hypothetical protein
MSALASRGRRVAIVFALVAACSGGCGGSNGCEHGCVGGCSRRGNDEQRRGHGELPLSVSSESEPLDLPALAPQPETSGIIVSLLRTDFSDDASWEELCAAVGRPIGDFEVVGAGGRAYAFVADRVAMTDDEHPILVIDLTDEQGRTLRVIPSEAWAVENDLSIGRIDFEQLVDAADEDGVFRGEGAPN